MHQNSQKHVYQDKNHSTLVLTSGSGSLAVTTSLKTSIHVGSSSLFILNTPSCWKLQLEQLLYYHCGQTLLVIYLLTV